MESLGGCVPVRIFGRGSRLCLLSFWRGDLALDLKSGTICAGDSERGSVAAYFSPVEAVSISLLHVPVDCEM